jgi:hypothetical protein
MQDKSATPTDQSLPPDGPARHRRPPDAVVLARAAMRTQPLPLLTPHDRLRVRVKRFAALPFLAVLGYYALGLCTFGVMAAGNVPGGGDVPLMVWQAAENTGPIALVVALAAGRWWV